MRIQKPHRALRLPVIALLLSLVAGIIIADRGGVSHVAAASSAHNQIAADLLKRV